METANESRVRPTDDDNQVWRITTHVCPNDEFAEGELTTDFETLPHTIRMSVDDMTSGYKHHASWQVVDVEYENEHPVMIMGEYFGTEYDRNAEEYYDTINTVVWELESFG